MYKDVKNRLYLMKALLVAFVIPLCFSTSFGNENVVDSLLNELKQVKEDTLKVGLFLNISWDYHVSNPKQTIAYAQRAFDLSKVISYKKGEASSLNHIGIGYDIQGDLDKAMNYYQAASDAAAEIDDKIGIRKYTNNVGLIHQRRGDYKKAMECFHKVLEMVDEEKEKKLASILLNNIGVIHSGEERYEKALEYFNYSLKIERALNDHLGLSLTLTNIGEQYQKLGKKAKALICYKEALAIAKKHGNKVGEAILLSNMGEAHLENNLLDLAEEFFPEALALAQEVGDKGTISQVLNNFAKLKSKQGKHQEAIKYAHQGLLMAREMGDKRAVTDLFETLTQSYVENEDFENAFEYKNLYNLAKDSLFSAEKSKQILELSTQYEIKRKETENALLKEQQAKNEAIIRQRTTIGFAVALILILVSVIAFILYTSNREKNKYSHRLENEVADRTSELEHSNVKLRESNKELERFAYIASHDLKEPLRNIMSFTRLVERKLPDEVKADQDVEEYLSYIINNTKQMHQLIEDVLEYSRVDNVKPEIEKIDLRKVVSTVTKVINSTLKERNVKINVGHLPNVNANSSQIFLVLKNLIENGIKYNKSEHPVISVFSNTKDGMHEISVSDNGIGIEGDYQNQIFGMFKRLHNREEFQGSGLGLSICKKVIQSLGGDIWVESEAGDGSKFTFSLPMVVEEIEKEAETIVDAVKV